MALDPWGDIYTTNNLVSGGEITAYSPGSKGLLLSFGFNFPQGLAFDKHGNLWVASPAAIAEFAAKSVKQLRYIETSQGCFAVAVDSADNVYAACGGNDRRGKIEVYAPHGRSPFRTITRGIDKPDALMFDRSGNLFVANCSPCDSYGKKQGGSITVYAPGGNVPVRTITDGIDWPAAMALDGDDGLVVANRPWVGSGSVTVYGSGSHPTLTITKGVASPDAIAVDSVGNIYASNWAIHERKRYSITVYSVAGNLLRTITDGVSLPSALAIGSN